MAEALPRSKSESAHSTTTHPTLQLHNEDSNPSANRQELNGYVRPRKPVNDIRTFFIWSFFNLIFLPFGVVCCYFSYKIRQYKQQNRYEQAKKWSKRTFVMNSMTTLLMAAVIITAVMLHNDYARRNPHDPSNLNKTTMAFIPWQPGR